jgi:predicted outer membrane repeat protein
MIITVTNTNDSGAGSLRQAIANAAAGDTIAFASNLANQTITLTTGQLTINKNLTIDGAGAANLKISGNNASRVFEVQALQGTFRNLIIANGLVDGNTELSAGGGIKTGDSGTILTVDNCQFNNNVAGHGGGAIFSGFKGNATVTNSKFNGNIGTGGNTERGGGAIATKSAGSLVVKGSEFTNNKGINGGAINSLLGTLTVENSIFKNNDTTAGSSGSGVMGYGGAIYTDGANASGPNFDYGLIGGNITIRNSQFDGNTGAGQGGALFLFAYYSDQINIENTTITNNTVIKDTKGDAFGAGVRIGISVGRYGSQPPTGGQFTIKNSTIANNTALSQGGGLWVGENSKGSITNSTFSRNKADDSQGNGLGGAMLFANGSNPVSVTNTTIAYNSAGFQGGAFWGGGNNITLTNTIVGYSTAGNPWGVKINTGSQFSDGGSNIQWPPKHPTDASDMNITSSPSLIIADPKLDPILKDNGGGLLTHALLIGSPAINTGTTTTATTDQRGFNRDSNPDIGAFEYNATNGNSYTTIESVGNTNFLKDTTNKYFAQIGTATPIAIKNGGQQIYQNIYAGWQTLAAETVNGNNQVLWKNTNSNYLHLWKLDANWNWVSSEGQWALNSAEALTQETNFGIDANGDGVIGNPYTPIESAGNTKLVKDTSNKYFTQIGTATPIAIKNGGQQIYQNIYAGWQTLAAETVNGNNQVLWKNTSGNFLHLWKLDANWNWVSSEGQWALNSPEALGKEAIFGIDANGDGKIGYGIIEATGNTTFLKDAANKYFTQIGTATPIAIKNGGQQIYQDIYPGWQTLAAETVNGNNQVLWKNTSGNYLHIWNLDSNWNWVSSEGQWALNSAEALGKEAIFGVDANGDGKIGNPSSLTLTGTSGNDFLVGGANNDIFTGAGGKDTLIGGLGSDRFVYQNLTDSLLANFDVITDFNATTGNDLFRVSTARAGFIDVGAVNTLDAAGIGAKLIAAAFGSNFAAQFNFGQRTFVAINDTTAGFNASTDGIIEVTGFTGIFSINNFTIV